MWTANDKGEPEFQLELADLLMRVPDGRLEEILPTATDWLRKRRDILSAADSHGCPRFLLLWDRFADVAFREREPSESGEQGNDDLLTRSLGSPGGMHLNSRAFQTACAEV